MPAGWMAGTSLTARWELFLGGQLLVPSAGQKGSKRALQKPFLGGAEKRMKTRKTPIKRR
eukprot:222962-Prorocentrum_lima.AAC.1